MIRLRPERDRVHVTVVGDLDLDDSQLLRRSLRDVLGSSDSSIDVDLGGVGFCDCSALNVR